MEICHTPMMTTSSENPVTAELQSPAIALNIVNTCSSPSCKRVPNEERGSIVNHMFNSCFLPFYFEAILLGSIVTFIILYWWCVAGMVGGGSPQETTRLSYIMPHITTSKTVDAQLAPH